MDWYYNYAHQQIGPVDETAVKALIAERKIVPSTLVWTRGMVTWQPAGSTALASLFQGGVESFALASAPANQADAEINELKNLFKWYWICLLLSLVTFGLSAIASSVLFLVLLYRSWLLIQDGNARTTPGKAVGYLFIPFYNFYWMFEAYAGLVKDTNKYILRYGLPVNRTDEGLATALCVLTLCCMIPYVNILAGIAVLVIQIVYLKNITDTSIDLIRSRS